MLVGLGSSLAGVEIVSKRLVENRRLVNLDLRRLRGRFLFQLFIFSCDLGELLLKFISLRRDAGEGGLQFILVSGASLGLDAQSHDFALQSLIFALSLLQLSVQPVVFLGQILASVALAAEHRGQDGTGLVALLALGGGLLGVHGAAGGLLLLHRRSGRGRNFDSGKRFSRTGGRAIAFIVHFNFILGI